MSIIWFGIKYKIKEKLVDKALFLNFFFFFETNGRQVEYK